MINRFLIHIMASCRRLAIHGKRLYKKLKTLRYTDAHIVFGNKVYITVHGIPCGSTKVKKKIKLHVHVYHLSTTMKTNRYYLIDNLLIQMDQDVSDLLQSNYLPKITVYVRILVSDKW